MCVGEWGCMYACLDECVCVCQWVCMYVYIYIKYIHTCMYTYNFCNSSFLPIVFLSFIYNPLYFFPSHSFFAVPCLCFFLVPLPLRLFITWLQTIFLDCSLDGMSNQWDVIFFPTRNFSSFYSISFQNFSQMLPITTRLDVTALNFYLCWLVTLYVHSGVCSFENPTFHKFYISRFSGCYCLMKFTRLVVESLRQVVINSQQLRKS